MLLSLVAHAVGYKMMVGAHNTVVVRRMWEVLPYSPCMVDDSTHNTADVQRHVGGALPHLSGMGVDGAHNTVGENVGAYNTAWVLFYRCIGYGPWYCGLT